MSSREIIFSHILLLYVDFLINFFKSFLFCFVFLAVFSSCSERGLFFVAVQELLIAVASLVAQHGL